MVSSKFKFRPGRVSVPQNIDGVPPVQINDWQVPQYFSVVFFPVSSTMARRKQGFWSVELKIFVTEDGVPNAFEVNIQQRDHHFESSGYKSPQAIKRWQLELVENEFHILLGQAIQRCVETIGYLSDGMWGAYKWISDGEVGGVEYGYFEVDPEFKSSSEQDLQSLSAFEVKSLDRKIQNLTHRRTQDRKHLKRVASIYNQELKRAKATGTRARMTKEVMIQMGTPEGTARLWIKNARDAELLFSSESIGNSTHNERSQRNGTSNTKSKTGKS